jgi:hypothetical protein
MKYTFRKYEFPNAEAASNAVAALGIDEEGNPTHRHTIAMLGHIVTTPATYNEEGEELTPAVLAKKYSVDVLWRDGIADGWEANIVWPDPVGVHSFGNSEANAEYTATLYTLFPDRVPVIDNDLND